MKRASRGISPHRYKDTEKSKTKRKAKGKSAMATSRSEVMRDRIASVIRSIPHGRVSTYGAVARATGYDGASRYVAAVLRRSAGMPWQRVLGSGGAIKLTGDSAIEQRLRLEAEGVRFRGRKVDMKAHEWKFGRRSGK